MESESSSSADLGGLEVCAAEAGGGEVGVGAETAVAEVVGAAA